MKTVELPGVKIDDVGSVWHDLLKKDFDVEAVGVNADGTFVYVSDDEEKDPKPTVESWVGKPSAQMDRFEVGRRRTEIMALLDGVKKRRTERAAARAAAEAEQLERKSLGYPELKVSSTGQPGMFGVVEALSNGVDSHTVLIQKVDPAGNVVDGSEELSVKTSHKVALSDATPKLSEGMAMVQVGPSVAVGDFVVEVSDRSGNMNPVKLSLRFVRQRSEQGPILPPVILQKSGGLMATIRGILGI
jgi:hypothetical protein